MPLVLEARGLDVTPDDRGSAGTRRRPAKRRLLLRRIYAEEIGHVAVGVRWFERLCRARGVDPEASFREAVRRCFKGELKPPFNRAARAAAGFPARYYEPLAACPRAQR